MRYKITSNGLFQCRNGKVQRNRIVEDTSDGVVRFNTVMVRYNYKASSHPYKVEKCFNTVMVRYNNYQEPEQMFAKSF